MFISSMVLQWIMTFSTYQQKLNKMYETAIPMGKMLNAFLAIHGRCKFIFFLRGQTPSLSAPTLILSLMEHFQGKAKNTVKHSIKSTFSISIQLNCNRLPGNPQLPPYIYIYTYILGINALYRVDFNIYHLLHGHSQYLYIYLPSYLIISPFYRYITSIHQLYHQLFLYNIHIFIFISAYWRRFAL